MYFSVGQQATKQQLNIYFLLKRKEEVWVGGRFKRKRPRNCEWTVSLYGHRLPPLLRHIRLSESSVSLKRCVQGLTDTSADVWWCFKAWTYLKHMRIPTHFTRSFCLVHNRFGFVIIFTLLNLIVSISCCSTSLFLHTPWRCFCFSRIWISGRTSPLMTINQTYHTYV